MTIAPGSEVEATIVSSDGARDAPTSRSAAGEDAPAVVRFAVTGTGPWGVRIPVTIRARDAQGRPLGEWKRAVPAGARWIERSIPLPAGHASPATLAVQVGDAIGTTGVASAAAASAQKPARSQPPRIALAMPRAIRPAAQASGASGPTAGPSNVLVYLIDTLRADHTSAYGYFRPTTPRLEQLAHEGILFENAYSTAGRTRPATASLLTSLYPSFHGAAAGLGLSSQVATLAERFRSAGWSTFAFVTNGNVYGQSFNFDQGFDRFLSFPGPNDKHARAGEVNERIFEILDQLRDEPFLLYVHSVDPHAPYDPPAGFRGKFSDPAYSGPVEPMKTLGKDLRALEATPADVAQIKALYDEDILYQDTMLGALLDRLEQLGIAERTIVIVTSDHGEEFHEHGNWSHGARLWEEQVRIPLIVKVPGDPELPGLRIREPVQLVDVMPTLLSWFALPGGEVCQGKDLGFLLAGTERAETFAKRPIYAEETRWIAGGDVLSLRLGALKVIRDGFGFDPQKDFQLFDLERDPGEKSSLAHAGDGRLGEMIGKLREYQDELKQRHRPEEGVAAPLDEKTMRNLEALGYVER
ncbi:MAG: sulfatase [Thermodesulfobacteriota bacterium]